MLEGLLQPMHLLVILIIALLIFGPKKLPEIGKSLGEGIRSFKDGVKDHPNSDPARGGDSASLASTSAADPAEKKDL